MSKWLWIPLCLAMTAATCSPAPVAAQEERGEATYRRFTNREGRTLRARIVSVDGDRVTVERRSGRRSTYRIAVFSAADQAYIREFAGRGKPASKTSKSAGWSRFRGPEGMGVSGATDLPLEWDAETNIAWQTPLPGAGASSPITYGDRVYITCYTGFFVPGQSGGSQEDLKRHLLAVRLADGEIIWNKAVPAKLPEEERIRDHGFAASSVMVDANRVYAFFGKSGVIAFDHEGEQLWLADVGSSTSGWGSAASPILHGGLLFVNASVESQSLVALDPRTGDEKWRAEGIRESWSTPSRDAKSSLSPGRATCWPSHRRPANSCGRARRTSNGTWFPVRSPLTESCTASAVARERPRSRCAPAAAAT